MKLSLWTEHYSTKGLLTAHALVNIMGYDLLIEMALKVIGKPMCKQTVHLVIMRNLQHIPAMFWETSFTM